MVNCANPDKVAMRLAPYVSYGIKPLPSYGLQVFLPVATVQMLAAQLGAASNMRRSKNSSNAALLPVDPTSFGKQIRSLTCPCQCGEVFSKAISPLGFDTFACGELFVGERNISAFYIIQWPERWSRFYKESGLLDRDPIVSELPRRRTAFTWGDLRTDRKFPKLGKAAIDLAATFGWREGLVIPMPQGGSRFGLVSMAGKELVTSETRDLLALLSVCLHSHVRTLVARQGCALPPAGLTVREIECIRLIATGKSDQGIAAALGIAISTAHEFVEKAKRKLKAKSRAELIAVAVSLALIEL